MSNTSSPAADLPTPQCMDLTSSWINKFLKPSKTIIHVERYTMLAAVFMLILTFLGTWRRRSHNPVIQYGVRGVYLLSFPLLSYTIGLMQGVIKNELFPVWAVLLVLLLGGTSSMSVERLDETKQWRRVWFELFLYGSYVGAITSPFVFAPDSKAMYTCIRYVVITILFLPLGMKNSERVAALYLASSHVASYSFNVARHMTGLFNQPPPRRSYDPHCMQGYRYMVLQIKQNIPGAGVRVITLDEIWRHGNNGVLDMDDGHPAIRYLKDMCLSFALFRLTVRRYFGYSCPESGLHMTRDLVLQGLLPRGEEDYRRAFQVIEVELAFLYDFFFTKYAAIMYRGVKMFVTLSLLVTMFIVAFGTYVLSHLKGGDDYLESLWESGLTKTRRHDILVTELLLCTLAVFQLLQIWLYLASNWAKVTLVCKYLTLETKTHSTAGKLLLLIGKASVFLEQRKWFPHWKNEMDQYSFLDSFNYPRPRCLETYAAAFFPLALIPMFGAGRKAGKSIPVPVEVKKAIARTLKDSNAQITNGASALQRHGMTNELYCWSCQTNGRFTLAHKIMTWHIATSYCDNNSPQVINTIPQDNRLVATSLSKYCAYLVAFLPELVPGNPPETEDMFNDLVKQARDVFSTATSDKYERLRELGNEGTQGGLLARGAILGMKLESIANPGTRWKLLADFWAELTLYIAPSDNVRAHVESLAEGGQFITHVWALLMHAGILDRPAACAAEEVE